MTRSALWKVHEFLLTPLREGRPVELWPIPPHWIFLLTPLREGRQWFLDTDHGTDYISTHAPAGGATCRAAARSSLRINFYSRPCGRGDKQPHRGRR